MTSTTFAGPNSSAAADVSLNVDSTITLSASTNAVNLAGSLNTTLTSVQTINVTTNSHNGYTLQFQMNDASTSLFNVLDTNKTCTNGFACVTTIPNHLASAYGTMDDLSTAVPLPNDTWGYNFSHNSTTLTAPHNTFYTVPDQTHPQVINSKYTPITGDPTYITFGAHPTNNLPSGHYQNSILYTATSTDSTPPELLVRNIQNITLNNCPTTITVARDTREPVTKYYAVQKLVNQDGNCWMLSNLAYGGSDAGTEFKSGNKWSTLNSDRLWVDPTNPNVFQYNSHPRCAAAYNSSYTINYEACGYFYNWCSALGPVAGIPDNCDTTDLEKNIPDAGVGLCPSGWKLPTVDQYVTLWGSLKHTDNIANSTIAGPTSIWRGVYAGRFNPEGNLDNRAGGLYNGGEFGNYWTSTTGEYAATSFGPYHNTRGGLYTKELSSYDHYYGFPVRCVISS
jgi:uncharacterized protein (TIGR02145 family)